MTEIYTEFIRQASHHLAELLVAEVPPEQLTQVHYTNQEAAVVLRRIGHQAMRLVFARLGHTVTDQAKAEGYSVECRPSIKVEVLFGSKSSRHICGVKAKGTDLLKND